METSLHCNNLRCRAVCADRALVTTCSHIFCETCAGSLRLLGDSFIDGAPSGNRASGQHHLQSIAHRKCPACKTALTKIDDVVLTTLNPSEDYKTCVLSGLAPGIIMECASRALAFWSYQVAQEIVYQEYLARSLTEKYQGLDQHLDKVIGEATKEIHGLQGKVDTLNNDFAALEAKNLKLLEAYREKAKNHQQLNKLYQAVKQQQLAAGVERAAQKDADHVVSGERLQSHRPSPTLQNRHQHGVPRATGGHRRGLESALADDSRHPGFEVMNGQGSYHTNAPATHRWPMEPPPPPAAPESRLARETSSHSFLRPSQSIPPLPAHQQLRDSGYISNATVDDRNGAGFASLGRPPLLTHSTIRYSPRSGSGSGSGGVSKMRKTYAPVPQYGLSAGVRMGRSHAHIRDSVF